MSRYVLAIKRDQLETYTREDLLQRVSGIDDLEVVGGGSNWLLVNVSREAIGQVQSRVAAWCHIEQEVRYRPSVWT